MDEDDLLQIDEIEDKENDNVPLLININKDISNITKSYKRLICHGLQSEQISMYIQRIPAQFGETRRIETIAQDLFPNLIFSKFSQKKLNYSRKRKLNCALFAESVWQIDRSADLALKEAFKEQPVFMGLYEVMCDVAKKKSKHMGKQNIKYSEEFTSFLVILEGISFRILDLFRQNLEGRSIRSIR
ncbi:hypothetical protein GLOIN_2v1488431 [Rhizophagus irregularis DAOM 181602=DAOM 197198]|uniref:Uncharacterized protein n=1 Tax=Rhizophagus irregularis (strain DAOM 181602 / DAOM 197198 / MUCL 43194) TaxID=747089 RepID=A0A2P4NZT6_RHIID|nr:hypothetical protein GLOIN_2v1488431 [Rhizophagus irregularis DAOM 181602=DAOM 197198]POG58642.1 hypothetical protein GLOIN_2v1488431 [Rhizophagus irregularis DAOM 181602=DAOM 197198]|eukprot:XP_025165508.1 hypothetical protein GLOIN_2v1488431 [Rhizophagus irregularis DAOM 181602=DAOM 197198]